MRNTGLEEAQAGIKTARRNINNLRHADETERADHDFASMTDGTDQLGRILEEGEIKIAMEGTWEPCRVHHEKCWAGGSTSWNQDCWEKYQ